MRDSSPRRRSMLSVVCLLAPVMVANDTALATFTLTGSVPLTSSGNHHGIAFDGSQWHIADPFTNIFHNYNSGFGFLGDTTVAGVSDMRGMTYDANSGHLFVGDDGTNIVREVTTAGTEIQQFNSGVSTLNALAYDRRDNSIWLAYFNGQIEKRTRTGTLISSFTKPQNWTGLALDPINNSLLAMEDGDTVWEMKFDGTTVGQVIPTDQIPNNGQGLAYDFNFGRLYATSQVPGNVTIFTDPSRVPEPASVAVMASACLLLSVRRRRDR